jgi:DNA polymerase-3 subunit delta
MPAAKTADTGQREELMGTTLHALDYVAQATKAPFRGLAVVYGDDPFLKRLARDKLREQTLSGQDSEFSLSVFDGEAAAWRDVMDELSTVALFGGDARLVIIERADDFVSEHRSRLEDFVAKEKPSGVLLLEVDTWPSNTRLAKATAQQGLSIECKAPPAAKVTKWMVSWAKSRHQAKLEAAAAEELLETIGPELGILDQEMAKLASFAGEGQAITPAMVGDLVGGWKSKTTWEMLDAACAGNAREALAELDRLLLGGEHPIGILAQVSSTLRRFVGAARRIEQAEEEGRRLGLRQALEEAGFRSFVLGKAETQLRQLGRQRAAQLLDWLVKADLGLKGASTLEPRWILEQLVVRMSAETELSRR